MSLHFVIHFFFLSVTIRALEVWGSHEALARERNLRKEVEREFQESRFIFNFSLREHVMMLRIFVLKQKFNM